MNYTVGLSLRVEDRVLSWFAKLFDKGKPQISEEELIVLCIKNPKHFSKIYDLYHHKVFSYVYRRVGDMDVSADICSETFVKVFTNLHKYQFRGFSFSSWLYKIATNELNGYFRQDQTRTRHIAIYSKTIDLISEMEEGCPVEEKLHRLQTALAQLESSEIQLLEWRFYEELSFKEIGYLMDISEDNAKVKTYRLIEKIKKYLFNTQKQ